MSERSAGFFDGMFDRTLLNLRRAWRDIAESARSAMGAPLRPDLPREDRERLREQMRTCLDGRGGEVSARARAAELGRSYLALSATGRKWFLRVLAESFDLDREEVDACCTRLLQASQGERPAAERALRKALEPPRVKLLTQFNALPEGVKFLVDMRAELMRLSREDAVLAGLEQDLKSLLASWFDIGFLELHRINWEAPAALLEKLMAYEAVHEIRGWTDLKNRLEPDRRCFAFFHPSLPGEPLIFVEVALVEGLATAVQPLLLRDRDEKAQRERAVRADTAIFYSISNCQEGLRGVSFGNFLIKQVVEELKAELPHLTRFSTLSPVPSFRRWLEQRAASDVDDLLRADESAALRRAAGAADGDDAGGVLLSLLKRETWWENSEAVEALRRPLVRLCALHLTSPAGAGRATDPVARFHLGNGARLERINWLGNIAPRGIKESFGFMVNYLYDPDAIEANHEAFARNGTVMRSPAIDALLGAAPAAVAAGRSRSRLH